MTELTTSPTQNGSPATAGEAPVISTAQNVDNDYAGRFARLTQKERQMQTLRESMKADREELESYRNLKKTAATNPNELLQKFGLSYGELTEKILTPEDKYESIEKRLAKFEQDQQDSLLKTQERTNQEAYDKGLNIIKSFVDERSDEYEYIKINEGYDDVLDLAAKYFKETGKYLSFEEAANLVEKHFEAEADKYTTSKKLQAKFQQSQQPKDGSSVSEKLFSSPSDTSKTLTNNATATATPQESVADDKILMQRAIQAYRSGAIKR